MKKKIIAISLLFVCAYSSVFAQSNTPKNRETLGNKISRFLNKTRKGAIKTGKQIGCAIGSEGSIDTDNDLIKVSGQYYMPLYSVNVYHGKEANNFQALCRKQFVSKYPNVKIMSVAIPQEEWLREPVEKEGSIVGYLQNMYCYIIGRDGNDGYLNAKFLFQQYKEVGGVYQLLQDKAPKWERTDVLTNKVYNKLLLK